MIFSNRPIDGGRGRHLHLLLGSLLQKDQESNLLPNVLPGHGGVLKLDDAIKEPANGLEPPTFVKLNRNETEDLASWRYVGSNHKSMLHTALPIELRWQ